MAARSSPERDAIGEEAPIRATALVLGEGKLWNEQAKVFEFILAMQKQLLTFADKALEVGMEEDLIGNFGSACKDLFVYGEKVADVRRKFAATAFVKFA